MKSSIFVFFILLSSLALAEPIKSTDETRNICEKAASSFGKGDVEKAFNVLEPYWPLPKEEIKNLAYTTKSQLQMVSSRFGKHIGHDYITSSKAGNSFIQHTFIAKFERHAVRYICVFYKPEDDWIVNAIYWDDNTSAIF